jgi:recombinational DNA repair protein RecR
MYGVVCVTCYYVAEPFRNREKKESIWNERARCRDCREYSKSRRQLLCSSVGRDVKLNCVASQKKVFVVLVETVWIW